MQFSNIICHMPKVPSLGRTYKQAGICVSSYQCSVWSWQEQWAMGTFVRLGPSLSPRPRAWFGPKENTKQGLHTTHHPPPHKFLLSSAQAQAQL